MGFLDDVKIAQMKGKQASDEYERINQREIYVVVRALVDYIKREILNEAERNCDKDDFCMQLYFCIPNMLGNNGPTLYERKNIWTGSGYSGCYEYCATKYMSDLRNILHQELQEDNILVSECLIGTIEKPYRDSSKNTGKTSLGVSIGYTAGDTFGNPQFRSNQVYIRSVYNQFNALNPIRCERKNGFVQLFNGVTKSILQGEMVQRILDTEDLEFLLKFSFLSK